MTTGGWIFLCISWAFIITLVTTTLTRTLRSK